ncbi:MAG: hypothetical protein PHX21_09250 [bacterium]|nr:hypothetical protein [bacterium]
MKRLLAGIAVLVIIGCGNNNTPPKKEFTPPVDNKITQDKADSYVQASKFLMEAIKKQETSLQKFIKRWKLSNDLSELSDSTYCEKNPEVTKSWTRLQDQWRRAELSAYTKAGLGEDEFNWIGGALADTINIDIQSRIQKQLQ